MHLGWGWFHCVLPKRGSRMGSKDRELSTRVRVRDFLLVFRSVGFSDIPIPAQMLCSPLTLIDFCTFSFLQLDGVSRAH